MSTKIAEILNRLIMYSMRSIIHDPKLSYSCKIRRLKAYADVLNEFRDTIQHALNEKKPLSKGDMYYWLTDLGVNGLKADQDYYNIVNYWLSYYDKLDDSGKLDVLEGLLNKMDDVFSRINEDLSELGALTNQS